MKRLGLLPLLLLTVPIVAAVEPVPEYALKAELVERFTRFVDWPKDALQPGRPFVIGLLGGDPFDGALDKVTTGRKVADRPIEVRRLSSPADILDCQAVFVAASEERHLEAILGHAARRPILTIADGRGFAARGVIINFVSAGDRVEFEVNLESAAAAGLSLSAKLLKLAHLVEGKR